MRLPSLLSTIPQPLVNFRWKDGTTHTMMTDHRLIALESRTAEQDRTIEELSAQVAEQWKVIERLQKQLSALTDRFLALEGQTAPGHEITRPPHW